MNCAKLQADIDKLSKLKAQFEEQVSAFGESSDSVAKIRKSNSELQATTDEILEQYVSDFIDNNPDCFEWALNTETKIPYGFIQDVAALPDGRVVITNNTGDVFIGMRAEDGTITFEETIQNTSNNVPTTVTAAPNGDIFLGTDFGFIRRLHKTDSGAITTETIGSLGDSVRESILLPNGDFFICGKDGYATIIPRQDDGSYGRPQSFTRPRQPNGLHTPDNASATATPDGNIIINTNNAGLQLFSRQPDGSYTLGEAFDTIEHVEKISTFPNGDLLIALETGEIYIKRKRDDGSYGQIELIRNLLPECPYSDFKIETLTPLPDGKILIGLHYAYWDEFDTEGTPFQEMYVCSLDSNNNYRISRSMVRMTNWLRKVTALPDGDVLAYAKGIGSIFGIHPPKPTLDELKDNLTRIAQKHA